MTIAFRVWSDCRIHGWYRTYNEVSETTGVPPKSIQRVAQEKGWLGRFRRSGDSMNRSVPNATMRFDQQIEALDGGREFTIMGFEAP